MLHVPEISGILEFSGLGQVFCAVAMFVEIAKSRDYNGYCCVTC
jgi:hypothetical protein